MSNAGGAASIERLPRVLVCVGPAPTSTQVIEAAAKLAGHRCCQWAALYVETGDGREEGGRSQALEHLRLAEHLGATAHIVEADAVAGGIVEFARHYQTDTIVLGAASGPRRRDIAGRLRRALPSGTVLHAVLVEPPMRRRVRSWRWLHMDATALVVALSTVVASAAASWLLQDTFAESDLIMLFLLGVCLVAYRFSLATSLLTSLLSVAAFDVFFVPPRFTFAVEKPTHLLTFAAMMLIGVTISSLSHRMRERGMRAREQAVRNAALFRLTRRLVDAGDIDAVARAGVETLHDVLGCDAALILCRDGGLEPDPRACAGVAFDGAVHRFAARRAVDERRPVGAATDLCPGLDATCLPLHGRQEVLGVVIVRTPSVGSLSDIDLRHLLEIFVQQLATAIERSRLSEQARRAALAAESERTRTALLSSVSHDLRTPLGTIMGAATAVLDGRLDPGAQRQLLMTIRAESARLERLLANLVELTRIESGPIEPRLEPQLIEELIGSALHRLRRAIGELGDSPPHITVHIASDVGLVPLDGLLIELLLINLVENATKYGRPASSSPARVDIAVERVATSQRDEDEVRISVRDHGPGLPPDVDPEQLFEKFVRRAPQGVGGAGLGLAICRAIALAHRGALSASNAADGPGAVFAVVLPIVAHEPFDDPVELDPPSLELARDLN